VEDDLGIKNYANLLSIFENRKPLDFNPGEEEEPHESPSVFYT